MLGVVLGKQVVVAAIVDAVSHVGYRSSARPEPGCPGISLLRDQPV
jgi:hypothetical protein